MKFQLCSKTKNIGCGDGVFLKWLILGFKSMRNSEKGFGQFKINPKLVQISARILGPIF